MTVHRSLPKTTIIISGYGKNFHFLHCFFTEVLRYISVLLPDDPEVERILLREQLEHADGIPRHFGQLHNNTGAPLQSAEY